MLGMTQLMEALNGPADVEDESAVMLEAMDNIDDGVMEAVTGEDLDADADDFDDDVETDMAGKGIGADDESKYEKLLKDIPEDEEGMEDDIAALTESFDPTLFG